MLAIRGIETRLRKLEAKRRPPEAVFFLAWGRDEAEIERTVADAKAGGDIGRGDTVVRAVWTGHNGTPPSRWVKDRDLSRAEDKVLVATMERRVVERRGAEALAGVHAHVKAMRAPRDLRIAEMSDEQLFAVALGEAVQ